MSSEASEGPRPEPSWARHIRRTLDAAALAALLLACAILVAILVLMNVEIVSRYLFGVSTLIADEYAGYGFAVLILLGFTYAHRRGAFLRVDLAATYLRGSIGRPVYSMGALLSMGLALFSLYVSYRTFALSWLFGSTSSFVSETPLWIPQAVLPAGFFLLALSFAEEAIRRLLGLEV